MSTSLSMPSLLHLLTTAILLAGVSLAAEGPVVVRTFEDDPPGRPPSRFRFAESRDAAPGRWIVAREDGNHVLAHSGEAAGGRGIAIAVIEGPRPRDLELSVRLRLRDGARAAGVVWRYQDPDNYYLAELRLSDQSVRVYRMVHGNRVRLEHEDGLELDPAAWHTLKVVQRRHGARLYLGGIKVFDVRDRTFREAGAAGVWSQGDSLAQFDELRLETRED
jgi:hypothetical protein